MSLLILVRHGQSVWNLEKRFTGWVDIDLTEQGKSEANKAGILIKEKNFVINHYYSSLQKRANHTLQIIQTVLEDKKDYTTTWQLNERHYGALTGLSKIEMIQKMGEDKIHKFRRSWDIKPEPLNIESPYHPSKIEAYRDLPKAILPSTESLKDTYERVINFFKDKVQKNLIKENVLISAHGNSIRALCKYLFKLDNDQISNLEIPTGNPLIIYFDKELGVKNCEYLDKERAKSLLVY